MEVREMMSKAQLLRRQLAELQAKVESTSQELAALNLALRRTMEESDATVSELSEEDFQAMLVGFNDPKRISVEVVHATRDKQRVKAIQLSPGATIDDAIMVSGILEDFPDIDLTSCKVGIHGAVKPLAHAVQEGDRVEIYRPVESGAST